MNNLSPHIVGRFTQSTSLCVKLTAQLNNQWQINDYSAVLGGHPIVLRLTTGA